MTKAHSANPDRGTVAEFTTAPPASAADAADPAYVEALRLGFDRTFLDEVVEMSYRCDGPANSHVSERETSAESGARFTPFSQLRAADHPFTRDAYLHIYGVLETLAGEAAERMYAGDETYRVLMEEATAVQTQLYSLWNTVVEHERRERMSGNIVEPRA